MRQRRIVLAVALALGTVLQIAWRIALVHGRTGPLALPDEGGYLIDARLLSGGLAADLSGWPLYRAGYALFIVPAYWFGHDAQSVYRAVLVINAAVNALVFPLAYLLAQRVLGMSRGTAMPLAFAAAAVPGVVFYSQWALSDAVLPVVVTAWLLCIGLWLDEDFRHRTAAGVAACALAALSDAAHARGVVIVGVTALVLVVASLRRWDARGRVAGLGATLALGALVAQGLNTWIAHRNWPRGTLSFAHQVSANLTSAHGLGRTAVVTVGALWATAAGTLGFGATAFATPLRLRRFAPRPAVVVSALIVVTAVAIAVSTAAAGFEEHRVGNWAYSRYVACLDPALIVAGVAALTTYGRRRGVRAVTWAATAVALAAIVVGIGARHQIATYYYVRFDFPEIAPLTRSWTALRVGTTTVVVVVALCLVSAVLIRRPRVGVPAVAVMLTSLGVYGGIADVAHITRPMQAELLPNGRTVLDAAGVPPREPVAIEACCWGKVPELQWEEWWGAPAFVTLDPAQPPEGYRVVVTTTTPPTHVHWRGWHRVVVTPTWTVWRRAGG